MREIVGIEAGHQLMGKQLLTPNQMNLKHVKIKDHKPVIQKHKDKETYQKNDLHCYEGDNCCTDC